MPNAVREPTELAMAELEKYVLWLGRGYGGRNVQVEPASAKQPSGQDEQDNQRAHEPHMCVEAGYTSPS